VCSSLVQSSSRHRLVGVEARTESVTTAIRVDRLSRSYGRRPGIEEITFSVEPGEIVGLLGPNGAGKTTTLRVLAGIIAPTGGTASVAGIPLSDPERLHQAVGLLPEAPGFYERETAWRNLVYFARFYEGILVPERVEACLRRFGLWERRDDRVASYSRGMKLRLALARALVHKPPVLLLDEPTAGLDPEAARDVRDLIRTLAHEDRVVLLSTHNLTEAEELCTRVALVRTRLLAYGPPLALREGIAPPVVIVRLESPVGIPSGLAALPFVRSARVDGDHLRVELVSETDRPRLVEALVRDGARVLEVTEERPSLEAAYLELVRDERRAG
jgi:ABC-2 type transport system ATP-binding protein